MPSGSMRMALLVLAEVACPRPSGTGKCLQSTPRACREDRCDDWQVQGLAQAEPIGVEVRPSRLRGNLTIALLLFGSLLLIAGWLIGIVLLWTSDQWNRRDKIIATLLLPGGIPVALLFALIAGARFGSCGFDRSGRSTGCSSLSPSPLPEPIATVLLVLGIAIPVVTAIYLHRRVRPSPS